MTSFGFGGSHPGTGGTNAKGEFGDMITGILDGGVEALFGKSREKALKPMRNGGCPIPPIPLETL